MTEEIKSSFVILGTGEIVQRRCSCSDETCNVGKHPGCWKSLGKLTAGMNVVLDDGRKGILLNPRGCHCGPHREPCWDVSLCDLSGGVQAYGGTFYPDLM